MGYVYVLTHPRLPGLVKIGHTEQGTPTSRAAEISSATGVPGAFVVAYSCECQDAPLVERAVHGLLSDARHDPKKEFFEISLCRAKACIETVVHNKLISDIPVGRRIESAVDFGRCIREARQRMGITQDELARMAGCGRRLVSEVERGKATAQFCLVLTLARCVGVSIINITSQPHWL